MQHRVQVTTLDGIVSVKEENLNRTWWNEVKGFGGWPAELLKEFGGPQSSDASFAQMRSWSAPPCREQILDTWGPRVCEVMEMALHQDVHLNGYLMNEFRYKPVFEGVAFTASEHTTRLLP